MLPTLPKSCPNKEFFWSVFSRIWAEYGKIRTRKTVFGHFSHTAEKSKPYWKVKIVINIVYIFYSAYIYLFKVNVGNTRTTCEIGFKLTIKTLERCKWRRLTSLLSTLNSFHPLFWYLHCWLWNRNYRLRYLLFVKNFTFNFDMLNKNLILSKLHVNMNWSIPFFHLIMMLSTNESGENEGELHEWRRVLQAQKERQKKYYQILRVSNHTEMFN